MLKEKGGTKAVEVKIHFLPISNEALREFPTTHSSVDFIHSVPSQSRQ